MLTLVCRLDSKAGNGSFRYLVQCDCGEIKSIAFSSMTSGRTKSCGCLQFRKGEDSPAYKHGRSHTKEYDTERHMKRAYGIDFEGYSYLIEKHNGVCAICRKSPPNHYKKRLCIDHCHTTGKIRGLLCDDCNTAIGLLQDSTELMSNAIHYLNNAKLVEDKR